MPGIDYRKILEVEYGIEARGVARQQQGQLERSIAEWQRVPEQQEQQQPAQLQLYQLDEVYGGIEYRG